MPWPPRSVDAIDLAREVPETTLCGWLDSAPSPPLPQALCCPSLLGGGSVTSHPCNPYSYPPGPIRAASQSTALGGAMLALFPDNVLFCSADLVLLPIAARFRLRFQDMAPPMTARILPLSYAGAHLVMRQMELSR
jgi:hypothetical protein